MTVSAPTVVLTRPVQDVKPWLDALQAQHVPTVVLPLLRIALIADAARWLRVWQDVQAGHYAAVMGVSSNAFRAFFANRPEGLGAKGIPSQVRFWATGAGSAHTLQSLGVPPMQIDQPVPDAAQMDSEHLWPVVASQVRLGQRVLMLRGASSGNNPAEAKPSGNPWLAHQLQAAGVVVDELAVYQRLAPIWGSAQLALLQWALQRRVVWLLSSSEALGHLPAAVDWSTQCAMATHPRIAKSAIERGFGQVISTQPQVQNVLACVASLSTDGALKGAMDAGLELSP